MQAKVTIKYVRNGRVETLTKYFNEDYESYTDFIPLIKVESEGDTFVFIEYPKFKSNKVYKKGSTTYHVNYKEHTKRNVTRERYKPNHHPRGDF